MILETLYYIEFIDKDDQIVGTLQLPKEERDALALIWSYGDDDERFPETAVTARTYYRQREQPVYGIDYGPGSIKRRFGGGRVPSGARQFSG